MRASPDQWRNLRWPARSRRIGAGITALLSDPALPNVGQCDRKHGSGDPDHPRFHASVHNQNHGLDAGTGGITADDLRDGDRHPLRQPEALADPGLNRGRSFGAIGRASSCERVCGNHGQSVRCFEKCESARKSCPGRSQRCFPSASLNFRCNSVLWPGREARGATGSAVILVMDDLQSTMNGKGHLR